MTSKTPPATDPESDAPMVPEAFAVRDAESANWVVRKIGESRLYAMRVKAWAATELRRAERQEQFYLGRYGKQIEDWARRQIERQHDRRKSVSLPAGTIGFRTERMRLAVVDEKRLLAWAKSHLPAAVQTVDTIQKTTLNEHLKLTGECPDGAEIVGGIERFAIVQKNIDFREGGTDEPSE